MSTSKKTLDKELHIRIDAKLQDSLNEIAKMNRLKTSTFCRYVLARHLNEYAHIQF